MDKPQMTVEQFAAHCGVTVSDAQAWIACIRLWMDKGYDLRSAVERHMSQMTRMTFWASRLDPKEVCVGLYDELRAKTSEAA